MTRPLFTSGGTVQAGDGIYLKRQADELLLRLCIDGNFVYILTPRQLGKSSLMVRTAQTLLQENIQPVIIDLNEIGAVLTANQWYLGLLTLIEEKLLLDTDVESWWESRSNLGVTQRLTKFFQSVLLKEIHTPIVIFIDEIDTTLGLDFTDDFYAAIRFLYVGRAHRPELKRLSVVLIGVATPGDLIRAAKRTPFNIGHRVDLTDFTLDEAIPLADGFSLPQVESHQLLEQVLAWTGGHPYLTQRLCQALVDDTSDTFEAADVDRVVKHTFLGERSTQENNLQFVRDMLTKRVSLEESVAILKLYREVLQKKKLFQEGERILANNYLMLSGIVCRRGKYLEVRNNIYRKVFGHKWIREYLPQNIYQRIKQPVVPIVGALGFFVGFFIMFFLFASNQQEDMNLLIQMEETSNLLSSRRAHDGLLMAIDTIIRSKSKRSIYFDHAKIILLNALNVSREKNIYPTNGIKNISTDFSPKEDKIVSGSDDGKLRLWDIRGNQIGQPFIGHNEEVYSVKFSTDGKRIVSGSKDGTLRLWDLQGNQIGEPFEGHNGEVFTVDISFHSNPVKARIISGGKDGRLRLWDLRGNQIGQPFEGHIGDISSVSFSPNGENIISGGHDKKLLLWDLKGNQIGQPFQGHENKVLSVSFSPDGKSIISGSLDRSLRLWNLKGEQISKPFIGHSRAISSVKFRSDGNLIASGSWDGTIRLWDRKGNLISAPIRGHIQQINSVDFSPDKKTLISASKDETLRLWDLKNLPFAGTSEVIWSVDYNQKQKLIASSGEDKAIRIWDLNGNQVGKPLFGHEGKVFSVSFSQDGKKIVSGSKKNIRIWDINGHHKSRILPGHKNRVWSAKFSPDMKYVVSGSNDKTIRLWNLDTNDSIKINGHEDYVYSVSFSPNGERIVSGSKDGTIRLWNLKGNQIGHSIDIDKQLEESVISSVSNSVRSVAFSPNGMFVISGHEDGSIRLWKLDESNIEPLTQVGKPFIGHNMPIRSVNFSQNNKLIVSASEDKTIRLWNLNGDPKGSPFIVHSDIVRSVVFAYESGSDQESIVSGSSDKTIRVSPIKWNELLRRSCERIKDHPSIKEPKLSFDPVISKDAKVACKKTKN